MSSLLLLLLAAAALAAGPHAAVARQLAAPVNTTGASVKGYATDCFLSAMSVDAGFLQKELAGKCVWGNFCGSKCTKTYNVAATDATDQCCKDHDFDSIWGTVNGNPLDKRACAAHQRLVNCANAVPFAQVRKCPIYCANSWCDTGRFGCRWSTQQVADAKKEAAQKLAKAFTALRTCMRC